MYCKLCRLPIFFGLTWQTVTTDGSYDVACPTTTGEITGHMPYVAPVNRVITQSWDAVRAQLITPGVRTFGDESFTSAPTPEV